MKTLDEKIAELKNLLSILDCKNPEYVDNFTELEIDAELLNMKLYFKTMED